MELIDTHCHLDDERLRASLEGVLTRAAQTGITHCIIPGVHRQQWEWLEKISPLYNSPITIYFAFGLHPWYCARHSESDLAALSEKAPNAVAIGECGLDFSPNKPDVDRQLHFFRQQLQIASDHSLPVIIHAVRALDITSRELRHFPTLNGVIHGYTGSFEQASRLIRQGFRIGIGSYVTSRKARNLHEVVRKLPLESLLLETDAPDRPGFEHRGKLNEPAYLTEVVHFIAKLRKNTPEQIAEACNQNAKELFAI